MEFRGVLHGERPCMAAYRMGRIAKKGGNGMESRHWEDLESRLRRDRERIGIALADERWVREAFRAWTHHLRCDGGTLSHDHEDALAVGMGVSLAIRDALIVSLVSGPEGCDERRMVAFASRPHDPPNVRVMYRILRRAFDDEDAVLDVDRCRRGLVMIDGIMSRVPGRLRAQPMALSGYIHWWMGEKRGLGLARAALAIDGTCSLAAIVTSAYDRDIFPANAVARSTGRTG